MRVEAKMLCAPNVRERKIETANDVPTKVHRSGSTRKTCCPIQTLEANISVAVELYRSDFSDTATFSDSEF